LEFAGGVRLRAGSQQPGSQKKITARLLDQSINAASRQHGKDKFQLPGCFDWSSRLLEAACQARQAARMRVRLEFQAARKK
jgi:hypothetical protein